MLDLVLKTPDKNFQSQLLGLGYSSLKPILFHPKSMDDFRQLKKIPASETLVIGTAQEETLIRMILQDKLIDGFINIEASTGRDYTHYRRSNLNQVLAKIAAEKGKVYFIDFSRILYSEKRPVLLGRIIQNIRILQKYRVPISIASFAKSPDDLRNRDMLTSFAKVLGVKKTRKIEEVFKDKQDRISGRIVRKGVRVLK